MILIDYNHLFLANIFTQKTNQIDENLVRHTVLSCTLSYRRQFKQQYGELVFCADGQKNVWRKNIFPYYKARRKKDREESTMDWHSIFGSLNKIREELKDYMPYKLLSVDTAEADDVIATIVKHYSEPTLILSSDQDFIQLQKYPHVKQYAPVQKRWVTHDDPVLFLKEKILRGDTGDGVPNILSDDDAIINPDKRQRPLREKALSGMVSLDPEKYEPEMKRKFERNEKLIDLLTFIPKEIEKEIIKQFESQTPTRKNMMPYFMKSGLKYLTENLSDF